MQNKNTIMQAYRNYIACYKYIIIIKQNNFTFNERRKNENSIYIICIVLKFIITHIFGTNV